jgi:hypothetical protein
VGSQCPMSLVATRAGHAYPLSWCWYMAAEGGGASLASSLAAMGWLRVGHFYRGGGSPGWPPRGSLALACAGCCCAWAGWLAAATACTVACARWVLRVEGCSIGAGWNIWDCAHAGCWVPRSQRQDGRRTGQAAHRVPEGRTSRSGCRSTGCRRAGPRAAGAGAQGAGEQDLAQRVPEHRVPEGRTSRSGCRSTGCRRAGPRAAGAGAQGAGGQDLAQWVP